MEEGGGGRRKGGGKDTHEPSCIHEYAIGIPSQMPRIGLCLRMEIRAVWNLAKRKMDAGDATCPRPLPRDPSSPSTSSPSWKFFLEPSNSWKRVNSAPPPGVPPPLRRRRRRKRRWRNHPETTPKTTSDRDRSFKKKHDTFSFPVFQQLLLLFLLLLLLLLPPPGVISLIVV